MTITTRRNEIIPVVYDEIDAFAERVRGFRDGQENDKDFTAFRLRQGVYGQRQTDAQMFRVKIPGGILTADQLEALGGVARRFAPLGKGHITTRENIQFHHLTLETAELALRLIGEAGLTSREACGNTVRNVITDPLAGVLADEAFDVTPYLIAFVRYFVRQPLTQNLPRKFKTSFSPSARDSAVAPFHDLGLVAAVRDVEGERRLGFAVYVGGGSSIMPRAALPLYDFVPVEDFLRVSEAVIRVFQKSDELRRNRMMARLKVLIDRIGLDAFRQLVEQELSEDWARLPIDPIPYADFSYEPVGQEIGRPLDPPDGPPAYHRWLETNVVRQRQNGYVAVQVTVPQGDLTADQFDALGRLARRYANGQARTTPEQNLYFRWVRADDARDLWEELRWIGLDRAGAEEITDITSCPGTDSCKLGITASMGLNRALGEALAELQLADPLVRKIHVKISGCPNGCGRHHLAQIGFQGAAVKDAAGRYVPAYEVYIGGRFGDGAFRYAERIAEKVPAKRVPEALRRIITYYLERRAAGEEFNDFADRVGLKSFAERVADLRRVDGMSEETFADYFDWERAEPYRVVRGEGECAR